MPELTLRWGGATPDAAHLLTVPAGATFTIAHQWADMRRTLSLCAGCTAGVPCPMYFQDEAAFDQEGLLQARTIAGQPAPFAPGEVYTGVLPQRSESPHLRSALGEAAMRLAYPYPCWPACPITAELQQQIDGPEREFLTQYLARARRAQLATEDDATVAADEGLLRIARLGGMNAPTALAELAAGWRPRLTAPALVPRVWCTMQGLAPLALSFAAVCRGSVCVLDAAATAAPVEMLTALEQCGWRYRRVASEAADIYAMDRLLNDLGFAGPEGGPNP